MESESNNKRDLLLYLLEKGDAMVCLDARREDVDVPLNHKANASLSLILNLNFRKPLEILEKIIYATLSFQGRPYKCIIPFEAVWAIFDPSFYEGQIWESSIPEDVQFDSNLVGNIKPKKLVKTLKAVPNSKEKKQRSTKGMKNEKKVEEKSTIIEPIPPAKRNRSHLRLIK